VAKFQTRVHVYAVEGGFPVFFDIDGRGSDIFPTGRFGFCIFYFLEMKMNRIPLCLNIKVIKILAVKNCEKQMYEILPCVYYRCKS